MMKIEGKTDAAVKWAKTWDELDGFLKLNALLTEDGDASFTTSYSEAQGEPFIDGTAKHEYIFGLRLMLPWSDGHDPINAEAEKLMEKWRDWVDAQYPENVPEWPGANIEGISALYDVPAVMVYQEDSLAAYNFQAKITYVE